MRRLWTMVCLSWAMAGAASATILPADYAQGITDIAGFASDDGWQHAISLHAGNLTEVFFGKGLGQDDVGEVPGAVAASAYNAPKFGSHRVMAVAQNDGDIVQVWFRSDDDVGSRVMGHVDSAEDIAAFEDASGLAHVLVLASDGHITEFTAKGVDPASHRALAFVPGATRIAAFQARDDNNCIVIVGQANGQVQEIFYASGGPIGSSTIIGAGTPLLDLGGFYTADDHFRHVILLDASGAVREFFYNPQKGNGIAVLGTDSLAHRVAAYTTNDGWRHVILGGSDGHLRELAFNGSKHTDSPLPGSPAAVTQATFVGPTLDVAHSQTQGSASPAGVTYALAGTEAARYAVSLDAGVWRSSGGLPWTALPNSPRYAQSISVDPNDVSHVFVGERDGDAGDTGTLSFNQAGLWESLDMGEHWGYALDPLTLSHRLSPLSFLPVTCQSQAVPAVFALDDGGALVATQCVVLRRQGRSGVFAPIDGFWGLGPFTAVAATTGGGHSWIWARTPTTLFWSKDGQGVESVTIPGSAVDVSGKTYSIMINSSKTGGEGFGFAAYGSRAAVVELAVDPSAPSPRVASLEFDALAGTWVVDTVDVGDGTGLGGRLFIKAEHAPSYTNASGVSAALLMSGAQTVFLGTPRGNPGLGSAVHGISWRAVAETPWQPTPPDHYLLASPSPIHSDLWDAHVSDNPTGAVLLIGGDGGVFSSTIQEIVSTPWGHSPPFVSINQGLTTQHVHVLAIVDPSYAHRSAVITAAVDNDAWWRGAAPFASTDRTWAHAGFGDANFTFADPGVSDAAMVWRHASVNGLVRRLTDLNPSLDNSTPVYPASQFRSTHQFSVVPNTAGTISSRTLQVVALARKDITTPDTHAVDCDGGPPDKGAVDGSDWDTVMVSTPNFAAHSIIHQPTPASDGWSLVGAAPVGAQRIWASAAGSATTYYFYVESDSNRLTAFYRQKGGQSFWDTLSGITAPLFADPYCAVNGPLFPNTFDPTVAYALATDGVWRLVGDSFVPDNTLTALVTRSGSYPVSASFQGGRTETAGVGSGLALHPSQATTLSTLVDVKFDAADPYRTVAASAFGSVFFMDQREGFWRDLTPALPQPLTTVSGVAIGHDGVYVSFEGRSVWKVDWPELAPEATFFRPPTSLGGIAVLLRASETATKVSPHPGGPGVAGSLVRVVVVATASQPSVLANVTTDAMGTVPFPPGLTAASLKGRVIQLSTQATSAFGPASWSFSQN